MVEEEERQDRDVAVSSGFLLTGNFIVYRVRPSTATSIAQTTDSVRQTGRLECNGQTHTLQQEKSQGSFASFKTAISRFFGEVRSLFAEKHPQDKAWGFVKAGRYKEAGDAFVKVRRYKEAGDAFVKAGSYKEAGDAFVKVESYKEAGDAFVKAGSYKEAGDAFVKAGSYKEAGDAFKSGGFKREAAACQTVEKMEFVFLNILNRTAFRGGSNS
ncbi:hypothetical protein DID99_34340 [Burkholderia sp. Bp8986]|nr:hypothetical protein DID99_34340 [Burkholderia sp. Bp8986]